MPLKVPDRFKVGITRYRRGVDDDDLADWWRRTFGEVWLKPERNAWLYEQNPCIGEDGPGPWLCRRDGEIVGQQGEVSFDLCVGEDTHRAIWAVDLEVDPPWRMRGVGPALMATMFEQRPIACMLDLTDDGLAAFTGAGCTDLGEVPTYRRPLDLRRAARIGGVPAALRRFVPVLAPLVRLVDDVAVGLVRAGGAKLVPVEKLDERVDEVWAAARPSYPVLARRDLAALAWRIEQRPDRESLRRYYLVRRGRAIGYVVLRETSSSDEPTVVVVDYLAPARWVAPLLLAAGRAARRDGAVALSVKTRNVPADRWLRATGFLRRKLAHDRARHFMLNCTLEDEGVCAALSREQNWFITATDSNLEIMTWGDDQVAASG